MANWQRKVDFSAYTEQYENGELSVQEFAKIVAEKLKSLQKFKNDYINEELEDIIYSFDCLGNKEFNNNDEDDFDDLLEHLYDWGDTSLDEGFNGKKVCWIKMR